MDDLEHASVALMNSTYIMYAAVFLVSLIMLANLWCIDPSSLTRINWGIFPEEDEEDNAAIIPEPQIQEKGDDSVIWALVRRGVREVCRTVVLVEELSDPKLRSLERKVINERRRRSEKSRAEVLM